LLIYLTVNQHIVALTTALVVIGLFFTYSYIKKSNSKKM